MGGFFCVTKLLGIALITCLLCNICCKLIISIPLSLNGNFKNSLSSRTTILAVPSMHLVLNLAKSLIASNIYVFGKDVINKYFICNADKCRQQG